jgi:hypothetical protein
MKTSKMKIYEQPTVKVVRFKVEGGFGPSQKEGGGSSEQEGWEVDAPIINRGNTISNRQFGEHDFSERSLF